MLSALIKKLIFVRQFSIDEGKIEILGQRHILLSDNAILQLQETDETKFYELMKDSALKQIENFVDRAKVYKQLKNTSIYDISILSKKLSGGSEGIVNTLQEIFNLYGLGTMEIVKLDNVKKEAVIRVRDSTIAHAYIKAKKKSSKPACVITAAILAAIFTYLFQKYVDAAEIRCSAMSGSNCEFEVK